MAENNTTSEKPVQMISWVSFPRKQAILKRLVDDKGNPGLILRVADNQDGEEIAKNAIAGGFRRRTSGHVFTMIFEKGKPIPFRVSQIAEMLGAETQRMPREKLLSKEMTIDLRMRSPRPVPAEDATGDGAATPEVVAPDPDSVETIGLNLRGEEVLRDSRGRYIKTTGANGEVGYQLEGEGDRPSHFLRARMPDDINGIAAGVIRMARKGTLHKRDLDRILDAAMEPGPQGQIVSERDDVADLLRGQLLRQITTVAIDRNADRTSFHQALRLSANTGYILSRPTAPDEELRPGAAFLSLIRRQSVAHDRVDFRGSPELGIALPRLNADDAPLQVQDFSEVSSNGLTDYAMNVLSRRPAEGTSLFIVPAGVEEDDFERLRSEVGRTYGLEAVAEIASGVADGIRDGRAVQVLFIGDRRPEALDALPQAAMRSFSVATDDDLVSLEREVMRSRGKIREFNRGEVANSEAEADDDREENVRQRPYQPLSKVGEPFTMIPRALEGATSKALERVARDTEEFGGADARVAAALGRSVADLGEIMTPEQVDAMALQLNAAERGRGFLEADQTGVGKGRTMAAIARAHLRVSPENRTLYVTESAAINVPDVLRDMKAVDGLREARVLLMTSGSEFVDISVDPATGDEIRREYVSPTRARRREIFQGGEWPDEYNMIITTYSQFNTRPVHADIEAPALDPESGDPLPCNMADWLVRISDDRTQFVLDESHNALNPRSNTGRNLRAALDRLSPQNVAFATGTPSRDPRGMDLYKPLLPRGDGANVDAILDNIASGGEVAQEAFATMLAEDGVMIRRDHDLSATNYQVDLPEDARLLEYQDTMNRFSPIVEGMIDVSTQIGEIVGRAQAVEYRRMVNAGMDERQARSMTNELSQYSLAIGGPLSHLARIMMNAIKVDQVVEAAVTEMDQGRKPLITFHSTNAALLNEMSRHPDGTRLTEEELAALPEMTIRDQIRRIHASLYKMKVDGITVDPRENNSATMLAFRRFESLSRRDGPAQHLDAERRMAEQISVIPDQTERAAISAEFDRIRLAIAPASPERELHEAVMSLSRQGHHDRDEAIPALDRLETALAVAGYVTQEIEAYIADYRAAEDFEQRRRAATSVDYALRSVPMPRTRGEVSAAEIAALGEALDAADGNRQEHDEISEAFARIEALIDEIPDLPVSPVDALVERLEANNIRAGEISGRTLCYREGQIRKRGSVNRRETVDAFNRGDLDALLYNSAGATGGSYHAGRTFEDQRPRTLIEFEAPIDIIKYVQAQGRGNRYDQVASPKVLSVMTGLTPEMRILQQRNGKLRSLGASVDGNRSHPLLLDDVPDLLNKVGDEATSNVLMSAPALARRLGFPRFTEDDALDVDGNYGDNDEGSGQDRSGLESLANKVLARSIMLPAPEQDDLIQRIRMEFDVLIEELDSRNANPLKPKEFGGTVDIRTTTIFSGQERDDDDLDTSVFLSPVYMSTGTHEIDEEPVTAERLVTMVERAITIHGSDGFKPYADRINQNMASLMRHYLPQGYDMDAAMRDPQAIPGRFNREYTKLADLSWVLENLQPGVNIKFPSATDIMGTKNRTVVDLVPPKDANHYEIASGYKIRTITPGSSETETIAVSRIMSNKTEDIMFRPGISDGFNDAYLREFSEAANLRQLMPVQILGGNILQAITTANEHKLGTISLYRDAEGHVNRGIVVHDSQIDMTMLPVPLPSALAASEVATQFARATGDYQRGDASTYMRIWGSMEPENAGPGPRDRADIIVRLTSRTVKIDMQPYRVNNADFYEDRPGLYEAIHGKALPDNPPVRAFRKPGTNHKYLSEFRVDTPEGRDRLYTIFQRLGNIPLVTDGTHRDLVNETLELINRDGPRGLECEDAEGVAFFEGETPDGEDAPEEGETFAAAEEDRPRAEWAAELDGMDF